MLLHLKAIWSLLLRRSWLKLESSRPSSSSKCRCKSQGSMERLSSSTWTLFLLCSFGFFKELRPSEPYLTEYLTTFVEISEEDLYQRIYPLWSYSYFVLLIPVFLVTDLLRYKPVVVFEGMAYVLTWSLLLWGRGVPLMQLMQIVYGVATSTEVAYYTYIYAKVPASEYRRVSSLTRFAFLMGRFGSGVLAQTLDLLQLLDYRQLNYVSLVSVAVAAVIAVALPSVDSSIYFHRARDNIDEEEVDESNDRSFTLRRALSNILFDLKASYCKSYVVQWSLWAAISTCINFQVGNYIQALWKTVIDNSHDSDQALFNGAVEAASTLVGAGVVFAAGHIKVPWDGLVGLLAVGVVGSVGAGCLFTMAITTNIWIVHLGYLLFRSSYQFLMTVATFEVASHIPRDSYGLILGINMWMALGLQTILTLTVADAAGLALAIRQQFGVYAALYVAAAAVIAVGGLIRTQRRQPADL